MRGQAPLQISNQLVAEDVEWFHNAERTRVRDQFAREEFQQLDDTTRRGVQLLADGLGDAWSADGLTTLVYSVPKISHGLPADAEPGPEVKAAQRSFFKAVYRLLVDAETGPRRASCCG